MPRYALAVVVALLVVAGYVALIYAFFNWVWPQLPVWANIIVVITLAVSFILSPLFVLLRFNRPPNQHK